MVVGEISQQRNLVIIGGGPGGYTAAIRAAQLGLTVTLVEQSSMGGICLNEGCIPSKIFTHAAGKRSETVHLREIGIGEGEDTFNLQTLQSYKTKVIDGLRAGVERLCQENKIEIIRGKATFTSVDRIGVENGHQFDIYEFKQAIIATGSSQVLPSILKEKGNRILLSREVFELEEVPEHLLVLGHDTIALEVASSYAAFGAKVSILLPGNTGLPFDESVNKELLRICKKRKINVVKDADIVTVTEQDNGITIVCKTGKDVHETIHGSDLFISEGRKPNLAPLGINRFGIELTAEGFVKVDGNMQSSIPSIYAIGDVTEGPLLAVKAIKQGKVAAEAIAGGKPEADLTFLPIVAHTLPPVASVGLTEKQARDFEIDVRVSQFVLGGNGYAAITGKKDGFVKVISDSTTDLVVGIHMIGDGAIEMSGSFVQLLEMAAKEEDITFPTYAHPSYNEGLLEAVEGLIGQAIHAAPAKRIPQDLSRK
ncbi:dihydrolipoyl dehydrogenase [Saccharococcus sp. Marseille-Q5394]|uniref:dihydrolipoyl dehydrogenase n=1 Tax=Saccharococcus sp. Marseille-Q5394 TaxID=2972778 RepID=UPI0021CA93A5|nr:dihydrolipoyl dehydrogenase [Saccharococcus sp. Marseille-Q5394]